MNTRERFSAKHPAIDQRLEALAQQLDTAGYVGYVGVHEMSPKDLEQWGCDRAIGRKSVSLTASFEVAGLHVILYAHRPLTESDLELILDAEE